jgi:hypothetical protein
MAITYTWKVTGIKVKDEGANKNAIVQTYWKKIGTDENGNVGEFSGATPFTSANVPDGQFVAFEALTEANVIAWVQSVVTGSYEEHVNEQIAKQLAKSDPVEIKMPWDTGVAPSGSAPTP